MSQLVYGDLGRGLSSVAVIMAGGSGTRFWPLSRRCRPKQFLPLAGGERSLIQATADRLEPLVGPKGILVVTAESQKDLVLEQLPGACVLAEPCPRNTAPCVGFAAKKVLESVGDVPMLCLPSDHVISGVEEMLEVFRKGISLARNADVLVTIGILPTRPETGYGYIRRGRPLEHLEDSFAGAFTVKQFVEKPNLDTAQRYLGSGEFFWNSGMFIWRPSVILEAINTHLPDMAAELDEIGRSLGMPEEYEKGVTHYERISPVSIDYGVLERAEEVAMLVGDTFEWSDVGSWSSWADTVAQWEADEERNVTEGETILLDVEGCAIVGGKKLIAGVGLKDLIVVDTEDALLVCHRDRSQDVKKLVEILKEDDKSELL